MNYREFFFKYRSYTPIPIILLAIIFSETTILSLAAGLIIAALGEMVRIWAVRYAGSATRTTGEVGADELVTTGPYGHTRNPLYLGNFLLSLGVLVIAWPLMPWFLLAYLTLFYFQYSSIISLEEDFLRNKFGELYQEYEKNVSRFLPQIERWKRGTRKPTPLKKALRTERNTLQSFSAVVLILIIKWLL